MIVASFCNFKFTFKTLLLLASTLKKERKKKKTKSKSHKKSQTPSTKRERMFLKMVYYTCTLKQFLKTANIELIMNESIAR